MNEIPALWFTSFAGAVCGLRSTGYQVAAVGATNSGVPTGAYFLGAASSRTVLSLGLPRLCPCTSPQVVPGGPSGLETQHLHMDYLCIPQAGLSSQN